MDNIRLLSQQQILAEWWQEVNEYFFIDTKPCLRRLIKALLEDALVIARDNYMQTSWHKHNLNREDSRNGFYPRTWKTQLGLIEKLWIPRCRKKSLAKELLKRYKDNEESINTLIKDIFLAGVSTNRVGEVLEPVIGKRISRQTVSNVVAKLDIEVEKYHTRPLKDTYLYLFLDGIVLNGKDSLGAKKRFVLVVYGVKPNGERELIDFMLAGSESYNAWYKIVNDVYKRGLTVTKLIITDGAKGLHKALDELYPRIKRQRCWVHKLRNMSKYIRKSISEDLLDEAKGIYKADTKRQAVKRFRRLKARWYRLAPKAIECLQKDIDEMLNFFECPKEHRRKIRTTNAIERVFREVRRRTRPMNCFTNDASCERILYGLFYYYNQKYKRNIVKVIAETSTDLTKAA
jgi:putative transposase